MRNWAAARPAHLAWSQLFFDGLKYAPATLLVRMDFFIAYFLSITHITSAPKKYTNKYGISHTQGIRKMALQKNFKFYTRKSIRKNSSHVFVRQKLYCSKLLSLFFFPMDFTSFLSPLYRKC